MLEEYLSVKGLVILISIISIVSPVSAAGSEIINTTSEWKDGTLIDVRAAGDKIFLRSEVPTEDWSNTNFDCPVSDLGIVKDYVYASSGNKTCSGHITKLDKSDGSIIWQEQKSGSSNEWLALEMGSDGYIYVSEQNEGVYRLDDSGNFNPTGTFPSGGLRYGPYDIRDYDLEEDDGVVYLADSTSNGLNLTSFYTSNASQKWHKNFADFSRDIDIYGDDLYVADLTPPYSPTDSLYRLDSSDGSIKNSIDDPSFEGSLDAIGKGPDGNIWVGHNAGVAVFTPDLNTRICSNLNYDHEIPAIAHDDSGVFTATHPLDRFNKMDGSCSIVWEEEPAPEAYITLKTDGRALYAGADRSSKVSGIAGAVDKFFREYEPDGSYVSKEFDWAGDSKYLDTVEVNSVLEGEKANLTVIWSNTTAFDPSSTSRKTFKLKDGINTYDLPYDNAKKFKLHSNLTSISTKDTSKIKSIKLNYTDNEPPQITDYSPSNGTTIDKDKSSQTISVDVSDPDTNGIDVNFYDGSGSQIGSTQTVSGGSGSASVSYSGLSEGNRYDWSVEVTDGSSTVSETHHFFTAADNLAQISNPDPSDGATVSPGTKTVSVDVEDVDGDDTVVEFYNDTGDLINTEIVSAGGPERVSASYKAPNYGQTYGWTVVAYQQGDSSKSTSQSYSFTTSSNPSPQIDSYSPLNSTTIDKDKSSQTISVDVSDPNSEDMDVTFFDDSGSQIGSVQTVTGGGPGTASVSYSGLSSGNRYDWSVEVTDGTSTVSETHHFFTAADQLPIIDNPNPSNGTGVNPGTKTVSADVEDPDGDETVVEIYDENGNYIGGKPLSSGGPDTVSASYSAPLYNHKYEWYVVAYRNGTPSKKTTKAYHFNTVANPEPQVTDYYPPNGTKLKPGPFKMNVTVDDPNNEDMTVEFYDDDYDSINNVTVSGGSGVAEVQHQAKGNGKTFNWYVEVNDSSSTVTKVYEYNTFKDSAPKFSRAWPKDNLTVQTYPANLSVFVEDDFASNIDIEFRDDNGNTIKTNTIGNKEFANASYVGMKDGNPYNWTIVATDDRSNTNTSEFKFYYDKPSFRPVKTRIESNYTDVISTESSSTVVPFKITNPSSKKELNITIDGDVRAAFVDGTSFKTLTMNKGSRTFLVEIKPDSPGRKEIRLDVENLQYGTFTTASKSVFVEESGSSYEQRNVPGIGGMQILTLLVTSTLAYFALL